MAGGGRGEASLPHSPACSPSSRRLSPSLGRAHLTKERDSTTGLVSRAGVTCVSSLVAGGHVLEPPPAAWGGSCGSEESSESCCCHQGRCHLPCSSREGEAGTGEITTL